MRHMTAAQEAARGRSMLNGIVGQPKVAYDAILHVQLLAGKRWEPCRQGFQAVDVARRHGQGVMAVLRAVMTGAPRSQSVGQS